ncbi:glycosyltransferase family 2 protein [Candidatus Saccharibacteria bacterium]|nr:glycosyltransferase family 2 protein [Candidatus Saccharibacteria bacterium]
MTTYPSVAVITRTKDRPLFLQRAIKSVHSQEYKNFTHVIINDAGDPQPVEELLEKYKELTQGRVKVIHNTDSRGMEAASNKAIKSVESKYVAIHDDDDSWHPNFLKYCVDHMESTGVMGVVVTTDRIIEEIADNEIKLLSTERWLPDLKEISLYRQCLDNFATPITFMYRRDVYKQIGFYDEELPVAGDWDFAIRFLSKYNIDYLNTQEALAYYHHRPSATGVNGNTVFAEKDKHLHFLNVLMNKYLRQDLENGTLGVGYIMNNLRYQRETIEMQLTRESSKLEGQLNDKAEYIVNETKHIAQQSKDSFAKIEERLGVIESKQDIVPVHKKITDKIRKIIQ